MFFIWRKRSSQTYGMGNLSCSTFVLRTDDRYTCTYLYMQRFIWKKSTFGIIKVTELAKGELNFVRNAKWVKKRMLIKLVYPVLKPLYKALHLKLEIYFLPWGLQAMTRRVIALERYLFCSAVFHNSMAIGTLCQAIAKDFTKQAQHNWRNVALKFTN